jgi:hypothetical protein
MGGSSLCWISEGDLKDVFCRTLLISEPALNNRTAALLGSLTNRGFMIVEQRSYVHCLVPRPFTSETPRRSGGSSIG